MTNQELKTKIKTEEYFVNMGPQHPAAHGVLRLILTIDGEIIKNVEPDLGYIHRSIEKMCERDSYQQIVHLTDRMDYLSLIIYIGYCGEQSNGPIHNILFKIAG